MASLMDLFNPQSQVVPPPPDPNSLTALMGLGSIDQRYKLLQQKADQANQLGQGTQVDYAHGKGTPLLLAGLANLFSAGLGGYQQGKSQLGLSSILDKQDAGNTTLAQGMLGAQPPNLASVLTAGPDALPGASQAASDAIAKQRQAGLMGLLSGSPQMAGAAKSLMGSTADEQQAMLSMPQARNQLAGGNLDIAAKLRGATTATSPAVANVGAALLKKMGIDVPEGMSAPEVSAVLPSAEKIYGEQKPTVVPIGSTVVDRSGKQLASNSGGGADGMLSPEALDQSARRYLQDGTLPSFGKANMSVHAAILRRAAELSPDADLATNKANLKANTASLVKAQGQADSIESFENTALKNLDNFLSVAKGINDSGIPILNKPIRAISDSLAGSPKQAQFNAARQVAIQEISKVLGGAGAGGAVTEGQRKEVEGLMRGDATLEQLQAVSQTLRQDMENRKASVGQQIQAIMGRLNGKPAAASEDNLGVVPMPPPPAQTATPHPQDAQAVQWAKAHPTDPLSAAILQANGATQ